MRTEEATQELRYLLDLLDAGGDENVPRDAIPSYLRTQSGRFRDASSAHTIGHYGLRLHEISRRLEAAASLLERAPSARGPGTLREAASWVGAAFREALELEGAAAAEFNGHALGPFELRAAVPHLSHRSRAICTRCGRGVWVDTRPPANGIELAGEALALECSPVHLDSGPRNTNALCGASSVGINEIERVDCPKCLDAHESP